MLTSCVDNAYIEAPTVFGKRIITADKAPARFMATERTFIDVHPTRLTPFGAINALFQQARLGRRCARDLLEIYKKT